MKPQKRVKVALQQSVINSKGVNHRRNGQNRNTRGQIATKNVASGFGAESCGIGPFTEQLR